MKLKALSGRTRKFTSLIQPAEQKFIHWMLPHIPKGIETYHLTLFSILLSLLLIYVAKIADGHRLFLVVHALIIFTQYIFDILDGALGRYRKTGLIRWGFYMDHLLDYFFAISAVLSYTIFFEINAELTAVLIAVVGAFFAHEFIIGNIRGMLNISGYYGFGPTEIRFSAICFNLILAVTNYKPSEMMFNVMIFSLVLIFTYVVWVTQNSLWHQDMKAKKTL